MTAAVVLDHHLDTVADPPVYRLTYGFPATESVQVLDPDWDASSGEAQALISQEQTTYEGVRDVVWDATDPRWHDDGGERRPLEDVAAEQRQIIKDVLDQRAVAAEHAADPPEPVALPGIGEAL